MKTLTLCLVGMFFLLVLTSGAYSYQRATVSVSPTGFGSGFVGFDYVEETQCEVGQDFILQIVPFSCEPAVVRSDLLEDGDVPVFCQIAATKVNPLMSVEVINDMDFSLHGANEYVRDVGFFPSKAAVSSDLGKLNSPILNNLGYALIIVRQQENEQEMPDVVEGEIRAILRYDLQDSFGVGRQSFYLPELSETEWNEQFVQYSFWKGKGFIRADNVYDDSAQITLYSGTGKVQTLNLKKGEDSSEIYLPGFDCYATLQLQLDDVVAGADTYARLNINGDIFEVQDNEKFLDGHCQIIDIEKKGFSEKVIFRCSGERYEFSFVPSVRMEIDGVVKEVSVGDELYSSPGQNAKKMYVGYIGETQEGVAFVVPVVSPAQTKEEFLKTTTYLALDEFVDAFMLQTGYWGADFVKASASALAGFGLVTTNWITAGSYPLGIYAIEGKELGIMKDVFDETVYGGRGKDSERGLIFPNTISFLAFAEPRDVDFDSEVREYYENALADFETVRSGYANLKYPETDSETLGEKAFIEKIKVAFNAGQKHSVVKMCAEFRNLYPDSYFVFALSTYCDDSVTLSGDSMINQNIVVANRVKQFTFEGIFEPSREEYSVAINVQGGGSVYTGTRILGKGDTIKISEDDYISLESLDTEYAVFNVNGVRGESGTLKVDLKQRKLFGGEEVGSGESQERVPTYSVYVNEINLEKVAKVRVVPKVRHTQTETNFSFSIGIEKRGIQLSPDKITSLVSGLEGSIEKFKSVSDGLGTVVKTLNTACIATNVYLTIKNFLSNSGITGKGGEAIARQEIMRGEGGWYTICTEKITAGEYSRIEDCISANTNFIDEDVEAYHDLLIAQNERIKTIQEDADCQTTNALGERDVDSDCFGNAYVERIREDLRTNLKTVANSEGNIVVQNKAIGVDNFVDNLSYDHVPLQDLRELELNALALSGGTGSSEFSAMAEQKVVSNVKGIFEDTERINALKNAQAQAEESGLSGVAFRYVKTKETKEEIYDGGYATKDIGTEITKDDLIQGVVYQNEEYYVKLEQIGQGFQYRVLDVYTLEGNALSEEEKAFANDLVFVKYDLSRYENFYTSSLAEGKPVIRYYETEPYKGLPAIVPFDKGEGWYVSVKPTFGTSSVLSSITGFDSGVRGYDLSGRPASVYICNVGDDGIEQNRGGDDICQQVNVGTGQPYNQFTGLNEADSLKLVRDAIGDGGALEQAARQYGNNLVRIEVGGRGRFDIEVGSPAVEIPDMQCEDFMSPSDCKLLFNVCDPVVCPSSRCDLGGAYPVRDVVQTGVVGSIALCLPNYPEVYVPVCLTGVKAGLDSYISIQESYRDCLQENLETGKTVGICDQIHSVYLCELGWKQGIPLAKFGFSKLLDISTGQSSKGGGEYIATQSAMDTAEQSVEYFTQYYASNAYSAFQARSIEEAGTDVCKLAVSATIPTSAPMLDLLTDPYSPAQFTARFEEVPLSSVTNPPISQYKVFYHIYAGETLGASYSVYLKGDPSSSFYQDTASNYVVATGYVEAGSYETATPDFSAPSGYRELCVRVNNQEECGFTQVTTDFGLNYLQDNYVSNQVTQNVTSESECVSGTPGVDSFSLASLNVQSAFEQSIDPKIYNYGIVRICATANPGLGTDELANINGSRWVDVGYCDNPKMRCWLDTNSVGDTIRHLDIEGETLLELEANFNELLEASGNYTKDFEADIEKIPQESMTAIEYLTGLLDRVFLGSQKGYTFYLRGIEYGNLARVGLLREGIPEAISDDEFEEDDVVVEDSFAVSLGRSEINGEMIEFIFNPFINVSELTFDYIEADPLRYRYSSSEANSVGWQFRRLGSNSLGGKEGWINYLQWNVISGDYEIVSEQGLNSIDILKFHLINLANKDYVEGIDFMLGEILDSGGSLETERVELSVDKEFATFRVDFRSYSSGGLLYLRYGFNGWEWSSEGTNWNLISDISGEDIADESQGQSFWNVGKLSSWQIKLLDEINDEDFYKGSQIIFSVNLEDFFLNIDEFWKSSQEIKDEVVGKQDCSDCGGGIGVIDICYEEECLEIGRLYGKNCVYLSPDFKLGLSWETIKNNWKAITPGGTCVEGDFLSAEVEVQFTSRNSEELYNLINASISNKISSRHLSANCKKYVNYIVEAATRNDIEDPILLLAIMNHESQCSASAFNSVSGDAGLMQINLAAHCGTKGLPADTNACKELLLNDVRLNVEVGAKILKTSYDAYAEGKKYTCHPDGDRYYSSWSAALRGYNGWNTICERNGNVVGNPRYVEEVLANYAMIIEYANA